MEVSAQQDISLPQGRWRVRPVDVAMGGVDGEAVQHQQGGVGENGEVENHLVHLGVAVAPHPGHGKVGKPPAQGVGVPHHVPQVEDLMEDILAAP